MTASVTERKYNFSAGPAVMPVPVLERIRDEIVCLPGVGASVMEISHRSKDFIAIIQAAEANLRKLLSIGDDYSVLFLQGGSRLQFTMIPMNLLGEGVSGDYIITGSWGKNSMKEAARIAKTRVAWDGADDKYTRLPAAGELDLDPSAGYAHFTSNETIEGVQFATEPDAGDVPLVCDASSDILSRPVDISKYGVLYACAQKNLGPAGVTIVIVRKDLLARSGEKLPSYLSYKEQDEKESLMNTAPTFAIYAVKLVTDWLLDDIGGLDKMHATNQQKAKMLYDVLDASPEFYLGHAAPECRSLMNVSFRLPSEDLTKQFLAEAAENNLVTLSGHRSVGGIRASIYNAMPVEGVEALRDFMVQFRDSNAG